MTKRIAQSCLLSVVLALSAVACGGDGGEAADIANAGTSRGSLSPEAQELLDLIARSRGLEFHAKYAARSPEPEGGTLTLEVWRKAPKVRQDTETVLSGSKTLTATIGDGGPVVGCAKFDKEAWSCKPLSSMSAQGFDDLLVLVEEAARGSRVTKSATSVNGRPSECFTMTRLR